MNQFPMADSKPRRRPVANDAVSALEIEASRRGRDDRFVQNEIQGIVSEFVSVAEFRVAGQHVDATGARFEPNDPAEARK